MIKCYKYRIYPNKNQVEFIDDHINACRFIYNWGLELRISRYKNENKSTSFYDTNKLLTQLKQQDGYSWLYDITAQSLEASLKNLDSAFTAFFKKKSKFPKFKSKKRAKQSFQIRQSIELDNESQKLYIPKLKSGINVVVDRPLIGTIKNGTITKTPSNKYFVSLQVEDSIELPELQPIDFNTALGIDLGLTHFLTDSNGRKVNNPRVLNKSLKKLKKLQRQLSKKKDGSKNKEKARIKVAKCYEKITNQRTDFLHKLTTELVNENQINTFCLETLNIEGMMKNRKLARSIGDVSWYFFIELLTYKCKWKGKNILFIGQFEPSSKMCSCGVINKELTLKDRSWTCKSCGKTHDRDILAAQNIKHFAFNEQNLMEYKHQGYKIIGMERPESKPVENKKYLFVETGSLEV